MAQKGNQAKPGKPQEPEKGDWAVHLKSGKVHRVDNAVLRQTQAVTPGSSGYQFRRDGRLVFEAPPGEVSFVAEREPDPPRLPVLVAVTLPDSLLRGITPAKVADLAAAINSALGVAGVQARAEIAVPGTEAAEDK